MRNNEDTKKERAKVGLFDYLFLLVILLATISIGLTVFYTSGNAKPDSSTNTESYTVAFNVNIEGETMESLSIKDGELITEPTAPTKEGYTFGGWYRDEACLYRWDFAHDKVTADTTLYPKWTPIAVPANYTVTFNKNGHGADTASQTIVDGNLVTKPTDPTETGYTFGGWFKDKDCEYKWDFAKDTVTADTTLYAKWTADTVAANYTVSFDMKGHGDQIDSRVVTEGSLLTAPTAPTETNYTFDGWYKDNSCEYKWDFAAEQVTANTTLYAKWTGKSFGVTLHSNDGSINDGYIASYEYGVGATLPTSVTKPGHSFGGWYDNEESTGDAIATISTTDTGAKAYWANWNVNSHTISFDLGASSMIKDTTYKDYGTIYRIPCLTDTLHNCFVEYWYLASDIGGEKLYPDDPILITSNITLVVGNWAPTMCNVNFNTNNGDTGWVTPVPYNTKVTEPSDPTWYGHSFGGWHLGTEDGELWDFDNQTVTNHITLVASWEEWL
ncbi:MAG: InlB B-repeat-containing protein [Bacilli bacterium]|nr:InlB B-repeat-containing protein [Bacilli bacterium]